MNMIRPFEDRDRDDVVRIWQEVGWIDDSEREAGSLGRFLQGGPGLVGEVDGAAECFVQRATGRIRYLDDDLALSVISAVTTSRVARRVGLASKMTGRLLADAAQAGAEVSVLGMFEQGFYDRLGFGSGSYEHRFNLDPATLSLPIPERKPVRLTVDDADEIHHLMSTRHRPHGGVALDDSSFIAAELGWYDNLVALGLRDHNDRLTGVLAGTAHGESAADLEVMIGETPGDVLDLLGVVRSLSDQWTRVWLPQPPSIQLQDVVERPIRQRRLRTETPGPQFHTAAAWWQVRILDLEAVISRVRWLGDPLRFALDLRDPLSDWDELGWSGLSGDWVIELGPEPRAERGSEPGLPGLSCDVGSFSRLWLGVRDASALALTTELSGPDHLLARLDEGLRLPSPDPGLYF